MKWLMGSIMLNLVLLNDVQALDISKWNLELNKNKKPIETAVAHYYEQDTFMMSISVCLEYSQPWQNGMLDYLSNALTEAKLMKYEIFMTPTKCWQQMARVSYHNLWYVDSFKAFRTLLQSVEEDQSNKIGKYFVVLLTATALNQAQEVQLILEKAFKRNIVDIVVAVYESNTTFTLYSYDMFRPQHCWQVSVKQVNTFQNGSFQNEELFPYKFSNFHSCPLNMYIRNSSLFYRYNLTEDGTQIASIEGVEANMIHTMAENLNFKLHMVYMGDNIEVGTVYKNGSVAGPFRYLTENKLDVLLGYYKQALRLRYFGRSSSYAFMPLVIVLSDYQETDLAKLWLFRPFTALTWLIIGLLYLLLIILVQLTRYYLSKAMTWLDVVGLVLENSRRLKFNMYLTKVAFLLCVFGIMVLSATFQGRLYRAFNTNSVHKITTVKQMVEANYTFLITPRFNIEIIRSLHIPSEQIDFIDAKDEYSIYETIRSYPSPAATFTNYWDFQMYIDAQKCYDEFDLLPLVVLLNQICAYTKKQSYLIEPIDRNINALKSGGILDKWLKNLTIYDISNEKSSEMKLAHEPLPLSMEKFQIVFTALISLYTISILVFLSELIARIRKSFTKF